jgi:hypothetical protein
MPLLHCFSIAFISVFFSFSFFFFSFYFLQHFYVCIIRISTIPRITPVEGMNAYMHKHVYKDTYICTCICDYRQILESFVVCKNRFIYEVRCSSSNKEYVLQLNLYDLHSVVFSKPHHIHSAQTLYIPLSKTQYATTLKLSLSPQTHHPVLSPLLSSPSFKSAPAELKTSQVLLHIK